MERKVLVEEKMSAYNGEGNKHENLNLNVKVVCLKEEKESGTVNLSYAIEWNDKSSEDISQRLLTTLFTESENAPEFYMIDFSGVFFERENEEKPEDKAVMVLAKDLKSLFKKVSKKAVGFLDSFDERNGQLKEMFGDSVTE